MVPSVHPRVAALVYCSALISGCDPAQEAESPTGGGGVPVLSAGAPNQPGPMAVGGMPTVATGGGGGMAGAGAGGAAGAAPQGGAGTTSAAAIEPVHVVHGFLPNADWLTITIQGYGMTDFDGLPVAVRVGHLERPEWSRCWGSSRIENGGFSIVLPDCDEVAVYKRRLAFIDLNQDGVCNEVVYGNSAAIRGDATFTLSDSNPPPTGEESMSTLFTEGDCAVFNEAWPEQ